MVTSSLRQPKTKKTMKRVPKLTQMSKVKEGFAKSYDGTKIWYQSVGKGKPIIFCNGLGCSTFYWKHVHTHYSKTHQSIIFDWRGHGRSEAPKNPNNISIDALTHDLHAVVKELKIKKAIFSGHSMGCQIVFNYYKNHPRLVKALIPCCGTFGHPLETLYNTPLSKHVFSLIYKFNHTFPRAANVFGYIFSKNPFWFQMGSAFKMMNPGLVDKTIIREYIKHFTSVDPVFLAKLTKSMQDDSGEDILKKIKVPTLIIAGEHDAFTPLWLSKKMHHLIPYSELLVIKKASHVALIEQPALINLRIEKFMDERIK
ncbi:hypothetical protein BVY03_03795 [bacterium K02(2017)]|nr:hypothetical protein BVY03_03795 [bacterium K02(2017)]